MKTEIESPIFKGQLTSPEINKLVEENTRLKAELVSFQLERAIRRMAEANETKLNFKVVQLKLLLKEAADLLKEVYPTESISIEKQIAVKKKFNQLEQYSI